MDILKQLIASDHLVRQLAKEKCKQPVSMEGDRGEPTDCGEVFVCGGACLPCLARRYVERYPLEQPIRR